MKIFLDFIDHSRAGRVLMIGGSALMLCAIGSFWTMRYEFIQMRHDNSTIARQLFPIVQEASNRSKEVAQEQSQTQDLIKVISQEVDQLNTDASQMQRLENTRLSGDSEYMRQFNQMTGSLREWQEEQTKRTEASLEKLSRILQALHAGVGVTPPAEQTPETKGSEKASNS